MTLVSPKNIEMINDEFPFMVANLYAKTKLGKMPWLIYRWKDQRIIKLLEVALSDQKRKIL